MLLLIIVLALNVSVVMITPYFTYHMVKRSPVDPNNTREDTENPNNRSLKWGVYLAIALTPVSLVMLLLWIFQGATLLNVMPQWNDGAYYWHQAASFAESGFETGYYVNEETPAPAEFSPFYAWGAGIPIFYGTLFKILGSSISIIPIINLACLTIALAVFMLVVRPSLHQAYWIWGLVAIFPFIYIPSTTSMIPLLEQSIAIVVAAFFYHLLMNDRPTALWIKISLSICLVFGVVVRPYWGILFLPYLLLLFPKYPFPATFASGLLFLGGVILQGWWSAYHPSFISTIVMEIIRTDGLLAGIYSLLKILGNNLISFMIPYGLNLTVVAHRFVFTFLIATSISVVFLHYKRLNRIDLSRSSVRVVLFSLYGLAGMFLLINIVTAFDVRILNKELRYMTPFVLMMILILIMTSLRRYMVYPFLAMILAVPVTLHQFNAIAENGTDVASYEQYIALHDTFEQMIEFESDAPNRWCNTLLVPLEPFVFDVPFLVSVTEGIGISWDINVRFFETDQFRSRYLALTDDMLQEMSVRDQLEPIADLPEGKLYLNLESDCFDE